MPSSPVVTSAADHPAPYPGWRWFRELNRYHWFVLLVAALGWLFDTMDQQLFALAKTPAMQELLREPTKDNVTLGATVTTSVFLVGWAFGGLIFGALGDRIGRARVMLWTIVIYSVCTGLSAFSTSIWDFSVYRFLTGLGVGGEFAVGVALVAEVMPARVRSYALGLLQASSTVGNSLGAVLSMALGALESSGAFAGATLGGFAVTSWRLMFIAGTLPALLALVIRARLKEPETWVVARRKRIDEPGPAGAQFGSYRALFADARWRHNALVGLAMGCSGIIGLWGIGFFSYDLFEGVLTRRFEELGVPADVAKGSKAFWKGVTSLLQNFGGFFGMYLFGFAAARIGRRLTFAICYVAAMLSTAMVFAWLDQFHELFWMIPLMGFCQLSLFGGFAIYLPELFPTHLRSTGISFCYNVGRVLAAIAPLAIGLLTTQVFTPDRGFQEGFRWAAVSMCAAFLVGLVALVYAPETRGQPLPE